MLDRGSRTDPVGSTPLFTIDLVDHSSLTFCNSPREERTKRRGSGSDGVYRPREGRQIQDSMRNGGRATRLMEIDGDVIRSMVERLDLAIFWYFSMVETIYTTDLNYSLLVVFLFSFLYFVLGSIIMVVIYPLTFVGVFVILSFSRSRVFVFIFMFLEIRPRGH